MVIQDEVIRNLFPNRTPTLLFQGLAALQYAKLIIVAINMSSQVFNSALSNTTQYEWILIPPDGIDGKVINQNIKDGNA